VFGEITNIASLEPAKLQINQTRGDISRKKNCMYIVMSLS
jgi:hypothetical protein